MLHWQLQQTMTKGKRDLLDWTNPIGKCLENFITIVCDNQTCSIGLSDKTPRKNHVDAEFPGKRGT